MSAVALSFAVLEIDHSPSALGWVIAAWTIPMVSFMLVGGALADRMPRALVLRGCNLIDGAAQGVIALLVLTDTAHIWQLVVLRFIAGTVSAVSYPAFHGMVPILLPEADRKGGYLLLGQSHSAVSIVGPGVAGVLVATTSPGWALAVDAGTYLVSAYFLTILRLPPMQRSDEPSTIGSEIRAGWGYAIALGWVLPIACCSLVFNAIRSGAVDVLGPVIAIGTVGSGGWGLARAAEGLGLFAFAFALARITLRRPLLACQVGFLAGALPMLVLALWTGVVPLWAAFFVSGCGMALINLAWSLTVQEKVPEEMLSRIMAIDGFFSAAAMPLGLLLVGPLASVFDARTIELGAVVLCIATFVVGATRPAIRQLRLHGPVT
jgi:hypothetical protein